MNNTAQQLLFWKAQYEKLLDENISLKENMAKGDLSQEQKIMLLSQEHYTLKQSQLKLRRELQLAKEEIQDIAKQRDIAKAALTEVTQLMEQAREQESTHRDQAYHSLQLRQSRVAQEQEQQLAINEALIKELKNKIAYDEDNMMMLKEEFQKKLQKIEKQSRLAELQSENIVLKEELRQMQAVLDSLEGPAQSQEQYYHCYVKQKKQLMTLMNELAAPLNLTPFFDNNQLYEPTKEMADVTPQKQKILQTLGQVLSQNSRQKSILKDSLYFLQNLQLQPIIHFLDLNRQQQLTKDIQQQEQLCKTILLTMGTHAHTDNKAFLESSLRVDKPPEVNRALLQEFSSKVRLEQIRLENIPALHLAKLYQTQVYLKFRIDGQPSQETQRYSLAPKSSTIHFSKDQPTFSLDGSAPMYLEISLLDKMGTYLGRVRDVLVTGPSKQIDQQLTDSVNYMLGASLRLVMTRL